MLFVLFILPPREIRDALCFSPFILVPPAQFFHCLSIIRFKQDDAPSVSLIFWAKFMPRHRSSIIYWNYQQKLTNEGYLCIFLWQFFPIISHYCIVFGGKYLSNNGMSGKWNNNKRTLCLRITSQACPGNPTYVLYANSDCYGYILPMARSNCALAMLKSLSAP